MDNNQRAKTDSYDRITKFDTDNSVDLATIPDYAAEQTIFDNAVKAIKDAAVVMAADSSGEAPESLAAKEKMAKTLVKYCRRGAVKARRAGNLALAAQLSHGKTYLIQAAKLDSLARAKDMRDALNNNLAICTNVTPANITEIDGTITFYTNQKDDPTTKLQHKKASGTDVIPGQIKIADEAVDNMYDYVVSYFEETKPTVVDALRLAKEIINTGLHHTEVNILILAEEDNSLLTTGSITDISNHNHVYNADSFTAVAHIARHKSGDFHFTVNCAGRIPVNFGCHVTRGTVNSFTVKLRRV